jgi:GNAT superfamily N-acetyltransferase
MNDQLYQADPHIVASWATGWAVAREVSSPVPDGGALRIEVGLPDHVRRYIFDAPTPAVRQLANTITEPYIFLKVCAPPDIVSALLPPGWIIQPQAFMMTCFGAMAPVNTLLHEGYVLDIREDISVPIVRILTTTGEVAAIGRIAFVGDYGIYDRIETHESHRRRKLGSIIMKTLEAVAAARGIHKGLLVATREGRSLYETLGWQLHSLYTTAEIPGPAV